MVRSRGPAHMGSRQGAKAQRVLAAGQGLSGWQRVRSWFVDVCAFRASLGGLAPWRETKAGCAA